MKAFLLLAIVLILSGLRAEGQGLSNEPKFRLSYLVDSSGRLTIDEITNQKFESVSGRRLNLGLSSAVYWIKIELSKSVHPSDILKIFNGTLTKVILYSKEGDSYGSQRFSIEKVAEFSSYKTQYPIFDLPVLTQSSVVYLQVWSHNVLDLPFYVNDRSHIMKSVSFDFLYFGIYAGIILVMFFYNSFLYFSVKDKNYLYYVIYILMVGLAQACLKGYSTLFLWPNNEWLIRQSVNLSIAMSGIFAIPFVVNFLNIRQNAPKFLYVLLALVVIYLIGIFISVSGNYILAQQVLQINASLVSITILVCGGYIFSQGYRPALFLIVSWFFFLSGVMIYILKDVGVLSFNIFTNNSILIGSGLEAALLSFALADKINTYKKEKEESQTQALLISKENEKLIREQNMVLEQRVEERTHALKESNESLQMTLDHLKETQAQLIEAEKMASLGQLTAGVAHEINNPINFVTSNVGPLKRDIRIVWDAMDAIQRVALSDLPVEEKEHQINRYREEQDIEYLKTEIDFLLRGMHEGANRTAEIVKSLRIFSRVDEDSLKFADINEGLDSTLVILNSVIRDGIHVNKQYAEVPLVECYPGKLNQVFLNIITNAIYAINKKFHGSTGGILEIRTAVTGDTVSISIQDNGIGIPDDIKDKIFEPFFTTKEVGEGTGLGMSIVYNTIKKHKGEIKVESQTGQGTKFVLMIPLMQQIG